VNSLRIAFACDESVRTGQGGAVVRELSKKSKVKAKKYKFPYVFNIRGTQKIKF
jgi:hypothetical protein